MMRKINSKYIRYLFISLPFAIFFLYFALLNKYHINHLEQNQLFLWNLDYLKEQFSLTGGLPLYSGSFFTQFFISSWLGAAIYTLNAFAVFLLSYYIFRKHNLVNTVISFVPVWLLAILQSNEFFAFSQAVGFLLLLAFFALYVSIDKSRLRYILFLTGWPVLYLLAGGFSICIVLFCGLHELLFRKEKNRYIIIVLYVIELFLVPILSARFIFFIQPDKIFIYPVVTDLHADFLYAQILLFAWTPLILVSTFLLYRIKLLKNGLSWNMNNMLIGMAIFVLMAFVVYKRAYNKRAEMMLGVDHYAQVAQWDNLLKLSDKYPGYNTLVIYYTNLALYKSGEMLDKMFDYPQIGSQGLRLTWKRNLNLFFGGEVFSQLAYNNESIHWAFEAMVAEGQNPRSLKKLAAGFIINGNYDIARKYLGILDNTLFYRKWAKERAKFLSDPDPGRKDPETAENSSLRVSTNFFSEVNGMNLKDLLRNHPENKMAYEYYIASLLLDKNLDDFAREALNLKYYNYRRIPLCIEEALIFYNFYEKQNVVPEGYSIRMETINKFNDYARTYSMYRGDRKVAAYELGKKYSKTYWYYLQFGNN